MNKPSKKRTRRGKKWKGPKQQPRLVEYRCQFCGAETPARDWKQDKCPKCGRAYDAILAQDSEE